MHIKPRSTRLSKLFGLLAQLVEQLTLNQWVIGSNPIQPICMLCISSMATLPQVCGNEYKRDWRNW